MAKIGEWNESATEESERVHEQLLSRFRMDMLSGLATEQSRTSGRVAFPKAPFGRYLVEFVSTVHGDVMMGNERREITCDSLDEARGKVAEAKNTGLERAVILDDHGRVVE